MKIINSKIFKILVALFILGFVVGIISFYIIGTKSNNIISYFESIKNDKFNYLYGLLNSIKYNYKTLFIIWICGLLLIFVFIIPLLECFRGFSAGFTITLIIYTYRLKGLILALIILFPIIINEIVYLFQSYYSIKLSIRTYNVLKKNKMINLKHYIKNYSIQTLIFFLVLTLSSLIEIYITSNIIKFVL